MNGAMVDVVVNGIKLNFFEATFQRRGVEQCAFSAQPYDDASSLLEVLRSTKISNNAYSQTKGCPFI